MPQRWIACLHAALLLSFALPAAAQELPGAEELEAPENEELPPLEAEEPEPVETGEGTETDATAEQPTTADGADATVGAKAGPAPQPAEPGDRDPRLVPAGLNLDGSIGLQHIAAAWGGEPKTYRIALLGEFYSGRNTIRFNDVNTMFAGNLLFEASPIRYFSGNLRLQTRSNINTFGRPQAMLSQGDLLVGGKGTFPVGDGLWFGADLTLDFPTDFGSAGLRFAGTGVRPRVLFSFDGSEMEAGINLKGHFNLGYKIDNTPNLLPEGVEPTRVEIFAYQLSAYNFFELGLGFQYDLPYVSPFLAWNLAIPSAGTDGVCDQPNLPCAADAGFASFPNVLSLGAKAEPVDNLGLHAGIDIGLTSEDAAGLPVTPPYTLVFGASWTIDPRPKIQIVEKPSTSKEAPPERVIVGTIVDAETKEPIANAIIGYQGDETPQASTEGGVFRSYGFMPGATVKLILRHPDYEELVHDEELGTEPGEQEVTLELKPLPAKAVIAGRVVNEAGEAVQSPKVKLTSTTGEEQYEPLANTDGTFEENVEAGKYTIAASAPGYLTQGRDVEVAVDGKVDVTIVLKPEAARVVSLRDDKIEIQEKIYFETGKASILPRSYGVLDQVAAVLVEHPEIRRLQVEGHTDDVGGDEFNMELSQARAESVRQYLVDAGISPERLFAKGFGETRPILPNTSKRNQSFNRRVEFNIIRE